MVQKSFSCWFKSINQTDSVLTRQHCIDVVDSQSLLSTVIKMKSLEKISCNQQIIGPSIGAEN